MLEKELLFKKLIVQQQKKLPSCSKIWSDNPWFMSFRQIGHWTHKEDSSQTRLSDVISLEIILFAADKKP